MSETRIIKKYPNRRLYDTEESRYITLADIKRLVLDKEDFTVIDKKSGDDITRSILLQVISEQEAQGEPIMSQDFLSQIIRAYSSAMPNFVSTYLEQSLKLFLNQQKQVRSQVKKVVGVDPVAAVAGVTQRNYERWKSVQEEIFRTLTRTRKEDQKQEDKRNNER